MIVARITIDVSDNEMEFLRRLARRNNVNVPQVLLLSATGKARKMPLPLENLFNELVIMGGSLRSLYACIKEKGVSPDTLVDVNSALERVDELTDMAWELIKVNKSVLSEQEDEAEEKPASPAKERQASLFD